MMVKPGLENQAGGSPLDAAAPGSLAVVGVHAAEPRVRGGGSSEVFPVGALTPLAGLREALPDRVRVVYEPGPEPPSRRRWGSGTPATPTPGCPA
ncbi:hypothetical protein [Streptomyces sp. NPDC058623]|uniref:hypothetical protein n=1 Tax=Streptomyces sp. NPDC058623 TaxID=3346563 RepID=UPI00364ABB4B